MTQLLERHSAESLVAFGSNGDKTAGDLLADAACVARALEGQLAPLAKRHTNAQALLVFQNDRYAFAVALLGCWAVGLPVALPPNLRAETLSSLLAQPQTLVLLHDMGVAGHLDVPDLLLRNSASSSQRVAPLVSAPSLDGVAAIALTSGSTGASESWGKTQAQLELEVSHWATTFELQPGFRALATVPPAHLYGLLFSVLLPLVAGGAFSRETPLHPEAVAARVLQHRADVLVTVPVHLRAARVIEPESFASLKRVFSSTAPLSESVTNSFVERHQQAITEIFGSTETGGIAWRDRGASQGWQSLTGVSVSVSEAGQLVVQSPYLSAGLPPAYETADRVKMLADGSFESLGRSDNIVKVGGVRVSLSALEEWLLKQPELADAAVVAVSEVARGARVLAALVLAENAARSFEGEGQFEGELRERMAEYFERVALPRRIIFLHRLPRDPSGKLPRHRVLRLFGLGVSGEGLSRKLARGETQSLSENKCSVSLKVPSDYAFFVGHFDSYPVMAGAVQLQELLAPLVRGERPSWGFLKGVTRVKFTGRISPGDELEVLLEFNDSAGECQFQIFSGARSVSAGRLSFQATESTITSEGAA